MKLAINGGSKVRSTTFPNQNTVLIEEKLAANRVLDSGRLTGYQGSWGPCFYGGTEIQALEAEWAEKFNVKHAIACNSATSGLIIACGAAGLERDLDMSAIVGPFSMSCSASAPLAWGATPVFVDIERDYYCIDANDVEKKITEHKSEVIIPVSLFGMGYDAERINSIAAKNHAIVIEDAAQAIGATLNGKYVGTLGDIGIYSFNYGKHLTCGEGGMIVTNHDELALRCRLIMNHAEAVNHGISMDPSMKDTIERVKHLFGFNLRLTEIQAAIMRVQLSKVDELVSKRVRNVDCLVSKLAGIPCLEMPKFREGATHTYYVLPIKYHGYDGGVHREVFLEAVRAELMHVQGHDHEGPPIRGGYIQPLQSMPLFEQPLESTPECTRQWKDELIIIHRLFGPNSQPSDMDCVADAFWKVWDNRHELQG